MNKNNEGIKRIINHQDILIEKISSLTGNIKDELIEVWEKSVRSSHHFLAEEDICFYRKRLREVYLQAVELYVIRNTRIVAFMGLSDDMVEMLFVLPSEKCKGYGTALLNYALHRKRIRKIDVNEDNQEAYTFYLSRGYEVVGRDTVDADGKPYPIIHLESPKA